VTRILEAKGFYLTDITITWTIALLDEHNNEAACCKTTPSARPAIVQDVPMSRDMAKSLFLDSRFYNDPFYTKEEADNLYQTWIENSIRGITAHAVFLIPDGGFITCRKLELNTGEIGLIGVRREMQRQELGKRLTLTAMGWFRSEGCSEVKVKTQLRNIAAMNFYSRLGFTIKEYSLIFGNIL